LKKEDTVVSVCGVTPSSHDSSVGPRSSLPPPSSSTLLQPVSFESSSGALLSSPHSPIVINPSNTLSPQIRTPRSNTSIPSNHSMTERMTRYSRFVYALIFISMVICSCITYTVASALSHFDRPFFITETTQPDFYYISYDGFSLLCLIVITYAVWIPKDGLKRRRAKKRGINSNANSTVNGNEDERWNGNASLSSNPQKFRDRSLMIFKQIWRLLFCCECWEACFWPVSYQQKRMRRGMQMQSPLTSVIGHSGRTPIQSENKRKANIKATAIGTHQGPGVGIDSTAESRRCGQVCTDAGTSTGAGAGVGADVGTGGSGAGADAGADAGAVGSGSSSGQVDEKWIRIKYEMADSRPAAGSITSSKITNCITTTTDEGLIFTLMSSIPEIGDQHNESPSEIAIHIASPD